MDTTNLSEEVKAFLQRQIVGIGIDCDIMSYTYKFDDLKLSVYENGELLSEWTVEQILNGDVYV